ncbi:MAG: hypothetical protein HRT71_14325 [Flavobacteriales bacterium]|nr:hypothetical protein [Flavobacteriales bacterium]
MIKLKSIILAIAAIALLLFAACKKEDVADYNADFVGEWHSDTVFDINTGMDVISYLLIDGDDSEYGYYCPVNCSWCRCTNTAQGKAKVNKDGTKLIIGGASNSATLSIDKEPTQDANGQWTCKLENFVLYKQ